ncbi:MAG: MBOAT family O-acyltransferase [Flavobacteriales bacterium]
MLFNSIEFSIFLPLVFLIYWFIAKSTKQQNILIVCSSYLFYGWWDWRFLFLILLSTIIDYSIGIKLNSETKLQKRKVLLYTSIILNLGILGFLKYCNFFIENFNSVFSFFGQPLEINTLNIILPVGISFYTFQTLSYTIDVYKGKMKATNNFIAFASFVGFFPQLVAGPIERAKNLLPQFTKPRKFNYTQASDGMRQILWGLFKKMVIADNCAVFANDIFNNYADYSGSTLLLGAIFFAFQIYGDFSGYSDIAIGTARLFGFNLIKNFAFPYFSRDIAEFWRRWHISLSTWFKDYLYIPLGGSKGSKLNNIKNVMIIFIVSGFWHGANWTFIAWGFINALYFLPLLLSNTNRKHISTVASNKLFPSMIEVYQIIKTFLLTIIAWIFFRANDMSHAFSYISKMIHKSIFSIPELITPKFDMLYTLVLLIIFVMIEWIHRNKEYGFEISYLTKKQRWSAYVLLIILIMTFGVFKENSFIYFQF